LSENRGGKIPAIRGRVGASLGFAGTGYWEKHPRLKQSINCASHESVHWGGGSGSNFGCGSNSGQAPILVFCTTCFYSFHYLRLNE